MKIKTGIHFIIVFSACFLLAYRFNDEFQLFLPLPEKENQPVKPLPLKTGGIEKFIGEEASKHSDQLKFATVTKEAGKIVQIDVLQKNRDTFPFIIGNSIGQISSIVPFSSKIKFVYEKHPMVLELDEVEFNYTPIYKFTDDLFAVLLFSKTTGDLEKVSYVNARKLMEIKPFYESV